MSKAEILEKYPDFGNNIFDAFGVIRCEKDSLEAEEKLNFWKEFYAHIEAICEYGGNTYYFGYNDDYSHLETTEKTKKHWMNFLSLQFSSFCNSSPPEFSFHPPAVVSRRW